MANFYEEVEEEICTMMDSMEQILIKLNEQLSGVTVEKALDILLYRRLKEASGEDKQKVTYVMQQVTERLGLSRVSYRPLREYLIERNAIGS